MDKPGLIAQMAETPAGVPGFTEEVEGHGPDGHGQPTTVGPGGCGADLCRRDLPQYHKPDKGGDAQENGAVAQCFFHAGCTMG